MGETNTVAAEVPATTTFLYGNLAVSPRQPMPRWLQIATAIGGVLALSACGSSGAGADSSSRSSVAGHGAATLEVGRPHHCLGEESGASTSDATVSASGPDVTEICVYDDGSGEGGIFQVAEPHKLMQRLKITHKNGQLCFDSVAGDKPQIHVCPAPFTPPFETTSPTS